MPNLKDINVKIKGDNSGLKQAFRESQAMSAKTAQKFSEVGRSIISGIEQPLAKANIKNKEFQGAMLQSTASMDRFIGISETGYLLYSRFTPQIGKTVAMFKALNTVQKASVIGAVVAGVAGAVAIYKALNAELNKNTELAKEIRSVNVEAQKSIVDEKFQVEELKEKYFNLSTSLEERRNIIGELQKISPEYFGNLNKEGSTYNEVRDAVNGYTAAILQNAKAKAAQDKIVEMSKRRLEIEEEIIQVSIKAGEQAASSIGNFVMAGRALYTQNVETKKLSSEYIQLGKAIDRLTEIYRTNAPAVEGAGVKTKKATKATKESTEASKEKKVELQALHTAELMLLNITERMVAQQRQKVVKAHQEVSERLHANTLLYRQNNDAKALASNGASFLASKIRQLINAGINPESQAIQALIQQYNRLSEVRGEPQDIDPIYKKGSDPGARIMKLKPTISRKPMEEFFHFYQREVEIALASAEILSTSTAQIGQIMGNVYAKREQDVERLYSKEIRMIEASKLSEEQKAQRIMAIEERKDQAMRKIQREQAVRNRNLALFQATINTAAGVTQALAQSNIAGAIAAGIYGGLQIAAIASEPMPALAKGGLAMGTTAAIVGDNPNSFIDPEVIKPVSELDKYISDRETSIHLTGGLTISNYQLKMFLEPADKSRTRLTA